MKSTDLARRDRDIRKARKKEEVLGRKTHKENRSLGDFINEFVDVFFFDQEKIYNIDMSEDILVLLEDMKEEVPEKQWSNIIRKAVKKTKVNQKESAINQLADLGSFKLTD